MSKVITFSRTFPSYHPRKGQLTFFVDCAINDGLEYRDFLDWFQYPKPFFGKIICWNDKIEY